MSVARIYLCSLRIGLTFLFFCFLFECPFLSPAPPSSRSSRRSSLPPASPQFEQAEEWGFSVRAAQSAPGGVRGQPRGARPAVGSASLVRQARLQSGARRSRACGVGETSTGSQPAPPRRRLVSRSRCVPGGRTALREEAGDVETGEGRGESDGAPGAGIGSQGPGGEAGVGRWVGRRGAGARREVESPEDFPEPDRSDWCRKPAWQSGVAGLGADAGGQPSRWQVSAGPPSPALEGVVDSRP